MHTKPKIIAKIIEKHFDGDNLTNVELMTLCERTGRVSNDLCGMGPVFRSAFKESFYIFESCADFAYHRGLVKLYDRYKPEVYTKWLKKNGE